MIENPYQPPQQLGYASKGRPRFIGPSIYIVVFGLIGAILGLSVERYGRGIVPLMACLGFAIGGIAYRVRARKWPIDFTARRRQIIFSSIVSVGLPTAIALFSGVRAQGKEMVLLGLVIGLGISIGIFFSGRRRPPPKPAITTGDSIP